MADRAALAKLRHDLRTPLNAIVGYSDLLREEAEEDGPADFIPDLQRIHIAGRRLLDLVSAVVDLSRLDGAAAPAIAHRQPRPASLRSGSP